MDAQVFYDKYLLLDVCICLHFLRQNVLPNTLAENHYNLNNTSFPGKILVYIVIHFALYDCIYGWKDLYAMIKHDAVSISKPLLDNCIFK